MNSNINNNNNNNNWETISVSSKMTGYTLRSLRCGTGYRLRVEAFNEMGSGEQSDTLEFSTLGRGKFFGILKNAKVLSVCFAAALSFLLQK